ncbi:MAG: UvrD-helicase domain-containing protein, partial [Solirubrobacterales bacterium]
MPASPGAITRQPPPVRVAEHRGGPLLVLGGAGSGRTASLVARFAALVADGVAPEAILLLTRGAAAAEALRARVEDALGDR